MILRPAGQGDVAAILSIWNPLIRDTAITFTTEERDAPGLSALVTGRGPAFIVAADGDDVLGFATHARFRPGPGYACTVEHTVILAAAARGQGTGRALMAALERQARDEGVRVMIGALSGENPGALAFHLRLGFAQVGHLPQVGHKFGRAMDLVLVQKRLTRADNPGETG